MMDQGTEMSDFGATHEEQIDALNDVVRELAIQVVKLKAEVIKLHEDNRELLDRFLDLQEAAEAIEGPSEWFHKDIQPAVADLHDAIRKVRGMA